MVGALGVVFGDIGTSPIYTMATVFDPTDPHPVPVNTANVYGVVSLVFWSIIMVVSVTYVSLAMRADNEGEGGIMALITLLQQKLSKRGKRTAVWLSALGIFGAALFLGDSMITPAMSMLSAVEGLKIVDPSLHDLVIPITTVIAVLLFLGQKRGTEAVGKLFGPIMVLWFLAIGALGVSGIADEPAVLRALSPTYALGFVFHHFNIAFFALAAVVLSFTGAEALYADMGHFGRRSISRSWTFLVLPMLTLSYFGQAALVLKDPANISGPFFLLAPGWARVGLVVLSTVATVIASQSVISGAFSVASQAAQLGYLPRLRIAHTSEKTIGQIYVPWINWLLMVSVLGLIFGFQSSARLTFAYGMAVTATITISTVLFLYVAWQRWKIPLPWIIVGGAVLLSGDLMFLAANLTKIIHGAWLPLLIGLIAFTIMTTWRRGRDIVTASRERLEGPLRPFVDKLQADKVVRVVPGTAIFLNRSSTTVPLALRANVEHNHVRHEHLAVVAIRTEPVPRIRQEDRMVVDSLGSGGDGIIQVTARFGYIETPNVPAALALLTEEQTEGRIDVDTCTYFLSKIELTPGPERTMPKWQKRLFIATSHITSAAATYFQLPQDRTVIMGSNVEV
ncbi:potassium transporter Kup [Streptacidiphilus pinicola]|uniref:Probable potassium transport system protein Kup n=2 Tax=Streptacidiphilus pinicola TaxID=2219663 RepID=A0A2X0JFV3_9ACTN|nr:potassium transporter Kup [Streptacidiphilus pinicola]